jgi:hypothetical protein
LQRLPARGARDFHAGVGIVGGDVLAAVGAGDGHAYSFRLFTWATPNPGIANPAPRAPAQAACCYVSKQCFRFWSNSLFCAGLSFLTSALAFSRTDLSLDIESPINLSIGSTLPRCGMILPLSVTLWTFAPSRRISIVLPLNVRVTVCWPTRWKFSP